MSFVETAGTLRTKRLVGFTGLAHRPGSGRPPATRFIHTGFLTGNSGGRPVAGATADEGVPGSWAMLADDFGAHPPDLILDTSDTDIRGARYYPPASTPLWATVQHDYRLIGFVDGVLLYRRVASSSSA